MILGYRCVAVEKNSPDEGDRPPPSALDDACYWSKVLRCIAEVYAGRRMVLKITTLIPRTFEYYFTWQNFAEKLKLRTLILDYSELSKSAQSNHMNHQK